MPACDGVFTAGPLTQGPLRQEGRQSRPLRPTTALTWQKVADRRRRPGLTSPWMRRAHRVYVASQDKLKVWDGSGLGHPGHAQATSSATPACGPSPPTRRTPRVVYVGGPRNTYASHATVCRSLDGGLTWRNLTVNAPLRGGIADGPHEVSAIRVHPVTREAWVNGQCYGMWRHRRAPRRASAGVSAALASAPPAILPPTIASLKTQKEAQAAH